MNLQHTYNLYASNKINCASDKVTHNEKQTNIYNREETIKLFDNLLADYPKHGSNRNGNQISNLPKAIQYQDKSKRKSFQMDRRNKTR